MCDADGEEEEGEKSEGEEEVRGGCVGGVGGAGASLFVLSIGGDLAGGAIFGVDGTEALYVVVIEVAFCGFTGGCGGVHGGSARGGVVESEDVSGFVCDGVLDVDGGL